MLLFFLCHSNSPTVEGLVERLFQSFPWKDSLFYNF